MRKAGVVEVRDRHYLLVEVLGLELDLVLGLYRRGGVIAEIYYSFF